MRKSEISVLTASSRYSQAAALKVLQAQLKAKEQTNSKQVRWLSPTEEEVSITKESLTDLHEELHEEDVADEGTSQDTEMQSDSTLRTKQEKKQFTDLQGQSPTRRLSRMKKQRVYETPKKTLTKNEEEMTATGQQKSEFRAREEEAAELKSNLETQKEEINVPREQLADFQREAKRFREKEEEVAKLQREATTNEQEKEALNERLEEFQGQEEQLREEKERVAEPNGQLRTKGEELRAMKEELIGFQGQGELLRESQQRATELQNQLREEQQRVVKQQTLLRANEQEMRAMREQLNEFQDQGERLREEQQRVTELQSQLTAKEEEIEWLREELNDLQGQDERFREQQQLVTELQSILEINQEEMRTLRQQQRATQQEETGPREWLINRNEIQFTDQELGRGAWGIVYWGKLHGCDVAVKQMYESIMSDHNRHLFEREVDIASKCRHPCLLQFLGATGDDGTPLLITELMDCSLREKLYRKDEPRLFPEEVSVISVDVAAAINYLHQKSLPIIHRDISSANVLLRQQGYQWRAKLSDYGTANFVRQSTKNDTGAAIYSAPETMNEDPDQRISCKVSTCVVRSH